MKCRRGRELGKLDWCTDKTPWKLSVLRTQLCSRVLSNLVLRAPSVTTLAGDVFQNLTDNPDFTADNPLGK